MTARKFTPTDYPLVDLKTGKITSQWRRFNEDVATAITPGSAGEIAGSDGTNIVWDKIRDTNVAAGAAIAWSKINKAGSSLADLATRSASDLDTGTLSAARLPTISQLACIGRTVTGIGAGVTDYLGVLDSTVEGDAFMVCPVPGTVRNLFVVADGSPAVGQTFAYTVRKNSVDQAVTCTIAGTGAIANDSTHSFPVAAGDLLTVKLVTSAGASTRKHQFGFEVATA